MRAFRCPFRTSIQSARATNASRMHYHPDDLHRLLSCVPTLRLNRPAPAESFLRNVVAAGNELAHVLRDYPHVRDEPLDFHSLCRQSLCALNDALLAGRTTAGFPSPRFCSIPQNTFPVQRLNRRLRDLQ